MTPQTLTKAAFARLCGVTKPGIAKAIESGKVNLHGKKVNLDHRLTKEYYFGKTGKFLKPVNHVKVKKKSIKKTTNKKPPVEPITAPVDDGEDEKVNPDIDLDKLDYENGYTLPKGINCFEDITIHNLHLIPGDLVKKVKELEVAKKAKQDRDVKRGKLIEREVVFKFVSQLYIIDVNQIKTQEDRIVPGLCGVFGVEDGGPESLKARKLIKNDSADLLESIQREVDDFLSGLGSVK